MKSESILPLAMVVLLAVSASAGTYSGGDGEPNNPYRIETPADLNEIGSHPDDFNDCFILVNDINMAGFLYDTAPVAPDTSSSAGFQGTAFTGIFDGNDHIISNLTIDTAGADKDYLGLFGQIGESGQVKNVCIEDVNIIGGHDSSFLGGLVGGNYYGTISHCYSKGSVSGGDASWDLGGLAGYNYDGSISNCYSKGQVSGGYSSWALGGLVGSNGSDGGTISRCYSTVQVQGEDYSEALGGLVGGNGGIITNCYSSGRVQGGNNSEHIGGLAGLNDDGTFISCYSNGQVSGDDYLGGLVGHDNMFGSYTTCFWDTDVNPDVNGIGNATDPNVIGESTTNMKRESTFTDSGWDFIEIWNIGENQTYPYLKVYPAGDLNHDGRVDFFDFAIAASHWLEGVEDD